MKFGRRNRETCFSEGEREEGSVILHVLLLVCTTQKENETKRNEICVYMFLVCETNGSGKRGEVALYGLTAADDRSGGDARQGFLLSVSSRLLWCGLSTAS